MKQVKLSLPKMLQVSQKVEQDTVCAIPAVPHRGHNRGVDAQFSTVLVLDQASSAVEQVGSTAETGTVQANEAESPLASKSQYLQLCASR